MPIDEFQVLVLSILSKNRNPNSYLAGGSVINAKPDSPRYSADLDLFHASLEAVQTSFASDLATLEKNGFAVTVSVQLRGFISAIASRSDNALKLDWASDSSFRFFPVEADPLMGYRLHPVDLATNKCLALVGRTEVRDILDALYLDSDVLPLSLTIWAACGKDPGLTPDLMLGQLRRNNRISPESLALERTVRPVDPVALKAKWSALLDRAERELNSLPATHLGAVFLDERGLVIRDPLKIKDGSPHFGSVGGAWPVVSGK